MVFEKGKHGGTINDLAIHGIDLIRYITGLEVESTVAARTWNAYANPYPDFKDCAQFMLKLNNGAGLIADVSYSSPKFQEPLPSYWEFTLWGDKGMMQFNYKNKNILQLYLSGGVSKKNIEAQAVNTCTLADFLCELNGGHPDTNTQEILKSSRAVLNIQANSI